MDNGEGANGGPYASSGGRSILGHKKGNRSEERRVGKECA